MVLGVDTEGFLANIILTCIGPPLSPLYSLNLNYQFHESRSNFPFLHGSRIWFISVLRKPEDRQL